MYDSPLPEITLNSIQFHNPGYGSEESDVTQEDEISMLNSQMQFHIFPIPPPLGEGR